MREWCYAENGQICGPIPEDQVQKMIRNRQLTEDTLVWCGESDFVERGWIRIADTELSLQIPINDDSFLNEPPAITSTPYYEKMENAQTSTNYVFSSNRRFDDDPRSSQSASGIIGVISVFIVLMLVMAGGISFWYVQQGKIRMPQSAQEFKGENYQDVITRLETAGFKNIETRIMDDLIAGWLKKDGEVELVSVNGETKFDSGSRFPMDAKIVVAYHTFPVKDNAKKPTPEVAEKFRHAQPIS